MFEDDLERQPGEAPQEGGDGSRSRGDRLRSRIGRLRPRVGRRASGDDRLRSAVEGAGLAVGDAAWFLRERIVWPVEDFFDRLGARGAVGVFGGGGVAVAGVVVALLIFASGGSRPDAGTTEAFVAPVPAAPAPFVTATPRPGEAKKPTGPTLHGAPPDFSPAGKAKEGIGGAKALRASTARRGTSSGDSGPSASKRGDSAVAGADQPAEGAADEAPASTAKIGSTPAASAAAEAQAEGARSGGTAVTAEASSADIGARTAVGGTGGGPELVGAPTPRAAKAVARRFAEAFVVYEVGGVEGKVRKAFGSTATKQLSRSLLRRPPRQPAGVKVPKAKVVNVVAGPSKGGVYSVSVALLRVGVTSELRLQVERGVGNAWQVADVLG